MISMELELNVRTIEHIRQKLDQLSQAGDIAAGILSRQMNEALTLDTLSKCRDRNDVYNSVFVFFSWDAIDVLGTLFVQESESGSDWWEQYQELVD